MIQDTERFKMDLVGGLERTLSGKVKPSKEINYSSVCQLLTSRVLPVITGCSIRHLYLLADIPPSTKDALIRTAKTMERRRCNHHALDQPLSTLECLCDVIDPKKSLINKNRYIVASQVLDVRRYCRGVKGTPLVYVKRSVMVMEPMAESSVGVREGVEKAKFRSGLRGRGAAITAKRKREDGESDDGKEAKSATGGGERAIKKKKTKGPKGPNPLSVQKPKQLKHSSTAAEKEQVINVFVSAGKGAPEDAEGNDVAIIGGGTGEFRDISAKRKRKRKPKSQQLEELAATIGGRGADSE